MKAYTVKSLVKNGQIILDLPPEFNDSLVEITVLQVVEPDVSTSHHTIYQTDSDLLPQAEEIATLYAEPKSDEHPEHSSVQTTPLSVDELGFIPPRIKINLSSLVGTLQLNMTIDEIDSLTKSWRDEWDRDFS